MNFVPILHLFVKIFQINRSSEKDWYSFSRYKEAVKAHLFEDLSNVFIFCKEHEKVFQYKNLERSDSSGCFQEYLGQKDRRTSLRDLEEINVIEDCLSRYNIREVTVSYRVLRPKSM